MFLLVKEMIKHIKHISQISEEFDTVICGVNGVISKGHKIKKETIDTLIKMYQSGKKIAIASNSGARVEDIFAFLKQEGIPMSIFYAIITAGEIAHYYLKKQTSDMNTYFSLSDSSPNFLAGLHYQQVDSVLMADFLLVGNTIMGYEIADCIPILDQASTVQLPMFCVGNNTSIFTDDGIKSAAGAIAEQYAMMGGRIFSFGKPDIRIAKYLTEGIDYFQTSRCLVIGDDMATDMRMGATFEAKNLLITSGIHQLKKGDVSAVNGLSKSFGLNVDYCMEELVW